MTELLMDRPDYVKHKFNPPLSEERIVVPRDERVMPDMLTKYEYQRIIGIRAQEIEKGFSSFLTESELSGETDAIKIAIMEYRSNKLDYSIVRIRSTLDVDRCNQYLVEIWNLDELMIFEEDALTKN